MKNFLVSILLYVFSFGVLALPPSIEIDRLLLQAKAALDARDYALATESLTKAEKLSDKLPDTFYYHYGRAHAGNGKFEQGRDMLEKYLTLSGTKGKFYQEALVEINNIEASIKKRDADKLAAIKKSEAEREAARIRYTSDLADYEKKVENCPNRFREHIDYLEKASLDSLAACQKLTGGYCNPERDKDFVAKRKNFLFTRRDGVDAYCENRYTKPQKPAVLR